MAEKGKKKVNVGDVFEIKLPGGDFAFGRVLDNAYAFYGRRFKERPSIEQILALPVIFKIWVMDSALGSGRWGVIGNRPLETSLKKPVDFFIQDPISKRLSIYRPDKPIPATIEQVQGMERAAAWSAEHVEDRLLDYFEGRPNKWVDSLKVKLLH